MTVVKEQPRLQRLPPGTSTTTNTTTMGQAISRRFGAAYDKALVRAEMQMDQEMKNSIKKNKYGFSDPSAAIGFTRGMDVIVQPTPEEEEVIRQQNEMPPVSILYPILFECVCVCVQYTVQYSTVRLYYFAFALRPELTRNCRQHISPLVRLLR